jgi:hypothetical protein
MVIQRRPLHFIGKTQLHDRPPGGHKAMLGGRIEQKSNSSYPKMVLSDSDDCRATGKPIESETSARAESSQGRPYWQVITGSASGDGSGERLRGEHAQST